MDHATIDTAQAGRAAARLTDHIVVATNDPSEDAFIILASEAGRLPLQSADLRDGQLTLERADGVREVIDLRGSPHRQRIEREFFDSAGLMLMTAPALPASDAVPESPDDLPGVDDVIFVGEGAPPESMKADEHADSGASQRIAS